MTTLTITHNAGLFSCFTIALQDIMKYYNFHGSLPDVIDRVHQFMHYKCSPTDNLVPVLFEDDCSIPLEDRQYFMSNDNREQQFSDYKKLRFNDLTHFARRWFQPGEQITNRVYDFKTKYNIVPENTIAVFHRGNDKVKETQIASDDEWVDIIRKMLQGLYYDFVTKSWIEFSILGADGNIIHAQSDMKLLVIPDNTEFADRCRKEFPDVIIINENHLYPADPGGCNFMKVPLQERPMHAINFFASVIIASQCKRLITHSGNGGFWAMVYRGHANGVHQYLNGEWI